MRLENSGHNSVAVASGAKLYPFFFLALLAFSLLAQIIYGAFGFLVPLTFGLAVALIMLLRSQAVRAIFFVWLAVFILGNLNYYYSVLSRSGRLGSVTVDPMGYALVYLIGTIFAIFGALLVQKFQRDPGRFATETPIGLSLQFALPFFAVIYLLSIIIFSHGIPILSKRSFVLELYLGDATPLAAFGLIVSIATIAAGTYPKSMPSALRLFHLLSIPFLLFVGVADGKRLFFLIGAVGIGISMYARAKGNLERVRFIVGGLGAALVYTVVESVRTYGVVDVNTRGAPLGSLGVEYSDSIYAFNVVSREAARDAGYNWISSTFGALVNGQLLSFIGLDKAGLIASDSARTFMKIFGVAFGIRLGIITELWFAFGAFFILPLFIFGAIIAISARVYGAASTQLTKLFALTLLSNFALACVGQSSVVFGLLPTMIYIFPILWLIENLDKSRSRRLK